MNYQMVKVEDLKLGDHILIDHTGTLLRTPLVVERINYAICLHHVHINQGCYDRGSEVGLNAPQNGTE